MKKKLFILIGLLTLFSFPLMGKGSQRERERRRGRKNYRFSVEQPLLTIEDDSSNNI